MSHRADGPLPTPSGELSPKEIEAWQKAVYDDPEWYFTHVLGISPWEKQIEISEAVKAHEKTIVPSCVSSGKTFTAAALISWWLNAFHPARVFTIAPTERQLKINLWGELQKMYYASRLPLGGELLTLDWKLGPNWYAKGFSPKDGLGIFGFHGEHDLVVIDDAQGVALEIFDALENASAGGTTRYLFLCNPAVTAGYVYDAIMGRKKIHKITISAFDTPNVADRKVVVPGLLTFEKVQEWIDEYGWDSDFVRVKVRALTPKQEPDTLIPIDWVEQAFDREYHVGALGEAVIGVDVGRFGDDKSVIVVRQERAIVKIVSMHGNATTEVVGRIREVADEYPKHDIYIDEIGVGGGVVDQLNEAGYNVHGVNVGVPAHDKERFVIKRDEIWWAARTSLDPQNPACICISEDVDDQERTSLEGDLTALKWTIQSDKKIVVEKKDKTKERIGRSTDYGDAYCLAVFKDYLTSAKPVSQHVNKSFLPQRPRWL